MRPYFSNLTLVMLNQDRHCLWKQCRSRSDGFWRSHLIRIYTVFHRVCEFIWTNNIELSDWLAVSNGCGKLNLFSRIRVKKNTLVREQERTKVVPIVCFKMIGNHFSASMTLHGYERLGGTIDSMNQWLIQYKWNILEGS